MLEELTARDDHQPVERRLSEIADIIPVIPASGQRDTERTAAGVSQRVNPVWRDIRIDGNEWLAVVDGIKSEGSGGGCIGQRRDGLGIDPGGRVALVAETSPHFVRFFWACQYAGLVPVPLPASVHIGGHAAYVAQLRQLLGNCEASAAMAPAEWLDFLKEATADMDLSLVGAPEDFDRLEALAGFILTECCADETREVANDG